MIDDVTILGRLRSHGRTGVVRVEDHFDTGVDDLWSALTDRERLGRWLGEFEGELRLGGEFTARFFASGWEGTGLVVACEPPRHLVLSTKDLTHDDASAGDPHAIEAWLTEEGDGTRLVVEERGMPVEQAAAYGAGVQIHVEDLASYVSGGGRCDAEARFGELFPAYTSLAVEPV